MQLETTYNIQPIEANFEALEHFVLSKTSGKENILVADEDIKFAKQDRAALRSLKEQIEVCRKQVKSAWNKPYMQFEERLKKITGLIDRPIMAIDVQIKDYESRKREARKERLLEEFDRWNFGDMLDFEILLESTWLNASVLEAKAVNALRDKCTKTAANVGVLEGLVTPETRTPVLSRFFNTLDLSLALAYNQELLAAKKKQEAFLGKANAPEPKEEAVVVEAAPQIQEPEVLRTFIVSIRATQAQIAGLQQYIFMNNLKVLQEKTI